MDFQIKGISTWSINHWKDSICDWHRSTSWNVFQDLAQSFCVKTYRGFQQVHVKCWSFGTADVNSAGRIVVFFRCLEVKMKNPWKSSVLGRLRYRHSDTVDLCRKKDVFLKLSRNKIHLPSGSEPTTAASATTPKGDWNEFIMQNDDSNLRIFLCIPRCFSKFGHPFWESKSPHDETFQFGWTIITVFDHQVVWNTEPSWNFRGVCVRRGTAEVETIDVSSSPFECRCKWPRFPHFQTNPMSLSHLSLFFTARIWWVTHLSRFLRQLRFPNPLETVWKIPQNCWRRPCTVISISGSCRFPTRW